MKFNFNEAQDLVDFFGGEDTEIEVEYLEDGEGHSGKGLYAYFVEYPEEGSILLGLENSTK